MEREDFSAGYHLEPPATAEQVKQAEAELGSALPPSYAALLAQTDGLSCDGRLVLLATQGIASRNADYEVAEYLPGYVMIGDDSGGVAIVMRVGGDEAVYEVDMGVMDSSDLRRSANSLDQLLGEYAGRTRGERG